MKKIPGWGQVRLYNVAVFVIGGGWGCLGVVV